MSKILIIEDDPDFTKVLSKRLTATGFEVINACDTYQGIRRAHEDNPNLIILDLQIPAGGGAAVLANIRESSYTAAIPVIVLTGVKGLESKQKILKMGVDAYLEKPFEPTYLIAVINNLLLKQDGAVSASIEVLLKDKIITQDQLNDAKDKQLGAKKPLQEVLVDMGFVTAENMDKAAANVANTSIANLNQQVIDNDAIKILPYTLAKRYGVFPLRIEDNVLVLATNDPKDIIALDDLKLITKIKIKPILATQKQITEYIEKYYHADDVVYDIIKNTSSSLEAKVTPPVKGQSPDDLLTQSALAPIINLLNIILNDAIKSRSADIHIEPAQDSLVIRYRIDGDLKNITQLHKSILAPLVARVKILSNLDISETRKPQDGRAEIFVNNKKIDLRISIIPTIHGEKIDIRILDPEEAKIEIDKLGFAPQELVILNEAIHKTQGMILVTGPTGSGKTSTLYAALNSIKYEKKNIMTIEDPVEYLISGITQIQVNPVKDVTFANGLRSLLRQDPNVILVGEIRDRDTADIAFRSSLTGHLVFSTIHTNSSIASFTRLLDIGLEPYLIASSVILVMAQRLVKTICPECKEEYSPDKVIIEKFKPYIEQLKIEKFYHGKGCRNCDYTGYRGRCAIFEFLQMDEAIRAIISKNFSEGTIFNEAKQHGFKTMAETGIVKVSQAITTLEEISRAIEVSDVEKETMKTQAVSENKLILIADDEENILKVVEKRLTTAGFNVIKARDGEELVALAVKNKPDLIITDVTMPRMNGFEATKALRSKLETTLIPIIMLTARQDKESELKGIDIGADDYMVKPFDSDKLLARVRMLLRRTG